MHCLPYRKKKRMKKLIKSSTVTRTVNKLTENGHIVTCSLDIYSEGIWLHPSEFLLHPASVVFIYAPVFNQLSSRLDTEKHLNFKCHKNTTTVLSTSLLQGNGDP